MLSGTLDTSSHFTPISVLCPGGTSDSKAFYTSHVYNLGQDLPNGYFAIGENAYILTSNLIIPYSGRHEQEMHSISFYPSFVSE
jgi:hypothetical protein